jgi:Holliday junction resolvase RusA-like endonuclease
VVGELDKRPPRLHQDLTVTVDGRPPTLNSRRHWRAVAADNKTWKAAVTLTAQAQRNEWEAAHGLKWRPLRLATLHVVFLVPDRRRRDWDNLISTVKPEVDALVAAGVIVDDSTEVVQTITFEVDYEKGVTATRFVVMELDDA